MTGAKWPRLTVRDRIVVHLADFTSVEREAQAAPDVTQEGLARAVGIQQRHVPQYVRPLMAQGLVAERIGHVRGARQRKKAYSLTSDGRSEAARLRGNLQAKVVEVETEDGLRTMSLGEASRGPLKGIPIMDLLRQLEAHGRLRPGELHRPVEGDREAASALAVPMTTGNRPSLPPLVDRFQELTRLREALEDLKAGKGCCILLAGDAGIGKSRLVMELSAEAPRTGILFLEGHTSESPGSPPLVPWLEVLRGLRSAVPPELLKKLLAPFTPVLVRFLPDLPTWTGMAALRLPPPLEFERFQLFDAITQILTGLSRQLPVILFMDDLHWADEASAQLLAYVHRNTVEERILFMVTYRPEEVVQDGTAEAVLYGLRRARRVEQMSVGPLGSEEVRQLAAGALQCERVDPRLASALVERGGGNPFLIQELVFSLRQEGRIAVEQGVASVRGSVIRFPGSVQHLIHRRLARLSPPTREMLMKASILGRSLRPQVLAGIVGKEWEAMLDLVDEALAGGFLQEDPANAQGPLLFADEWVRACLYDSISQTRRRTYHRRAAEVLTSLPESSPDELGYHYAEAGMPGPACRYLEAAGDEAMTLSSFRRAVERYEQTLELSPQEDSHGNGRVLKKLGDAYQGSGKPHEAREAYLRARQHVKGPAEDASIGVRLGEVYVDLWDVPSLHEELDRTLRLLGEEKVPDAARAYNLLSFMLLDMDGDQEGAAKAARRALEIATVAGERGQLHGALNNLAWAHLVACRWEEAQANLSRLEDTIEAGGKPEELASRYHDLGVAYREVLPDYGKATKYYQRELEIRRRVGDVRDVLDAQSHLGLTYFQAGQWDEGEKNIRTALEAAMDLLECWNLIPHFQIYRARVAAHRGDLAEAERDILAALASPEWYERVHKGTFAQVLLAWVRAEAGNLSGARVAMRSAFELIQQHGDCGWCAPFAWPVAAHIETLGPDGDAQVIQRAERWARERGNPFAKAKIGVLAAKWGRLHGAPTEEGLKEAETYFRGIGDPFELATATHEHALTLHVLGSASEAEAYLEKALKIYSKLGAKRRVADVLESKRIIGGGAGA